MINQDSEKTTADGGKWLSCFMWQAAEFCICVYYRWSRDFVQDFQSINGGWQGSILGPFLFIIYIINLDHNVSDANVHFYADDT